MAVDNLNVRMSEKEVQLMRKYLTQETVYLEYGCGGSTELAVSVGCKMIISVESDKNWVEKLRENPNIAQRIAENTLFFDYVDIGPTGPWGHPIDEAKLKQWVSYPIKPFSRALEYDFILVDGRFRNACALASYAHMLDRTLIAIHDYVVRHSYFEVEKFFDLVDLADTLAVFKKKKSIVIPSYYRSIIENLFRP